MPERVGGPLTEGLIRGGTSMNNHVTIRALEMYS